MRKPRDYIYYIGGTLCLVLSAFLLFQSGLIPTNLTNRIYVDNTVRGYRDYYHFDISLHRNDLRQAAAYLPVYSITEQEDMSKFLASFGMDQVALYDGGDYYRAKTDDGRQLRIYKFLDKLVYLSENGERGEAEVAAEVAGEEAKEIAKDFVKQHLFMAGSFEASVRTYGVGHIVSFVETLGKIPNRAFPTTVVVDAFGNIVSAEHYYFDYEELMRTDLKTPAQAIAYLPRNHSGRVRIMSFELVYIFENSILQPAYIFKGQYPDGSDFAAIVNALKFD